MISKKNRDLLHARDEQCLGRGVLPGECFGPLEAHHIVGRGMGGSKKHEGPEWTCLLCSGHNSSIESDAETRRVAVAKGLFVSRSAWWLKNAAGAVVTDPNGQPWQLNPDGTKEAPSWND